jgi:hypothetical protein
MRVYGATHLKHNPRSELVVECIALLGKSATALSSSVRPSTMTKDSSLNRSGARSRSDHSRL